MSDHVPPYPGTEGAPALSTSEYHHVYEDQPRPSSLVNLTPHEVVIFLPEYKLIIPPSGKVARVEVKLRRIGAIDGIPTVVGVYGSVTGLPSPEDVCQMCGRVLSVCGCYQPPQKPVNYIVSAMVRAALPTRLDLVSPADFVRDSAGKIVGCKSLEINQVA
jgi:hypothetical protein